IDTNSRVIRSLERSPTMSVRSLRALFAVLFTVMIAAPAFAQEQQQQGGNRSDRSDRGADRGGDRGGRGPGGGFDPARAREWFQGQIKEQMGATDEEWKVIDPKLTKVMDARRDSGGMGGFGFRRRDDNNRGGDSTTTDSSPVQAAMRELRNVLE